MADSRSDSNEDRVTHAWAAGMSPHVSPPPAQSAAAQAPASSTTHGSITDAVGSAAAQTEDTPEGATGIVVHMTVETVTETSAAAEEAAPPPHSPPGRRFLADRRRVYKLQNLDDGRQRLTPRDGVVPECQDPGLVYNEVLHIHWRDGQELRIHVHVRSDGRTVILRALTPDEQIVWEDILRENRGIEPRLMAFGGARLRPWGT
ncbi:hypothetical protein IWX90DRAFT_508414 [Phyllosticta citrichinensis]|uniref:Uncharacterized protein n=1 Tax=Phyllosticta citrichinensis TaxID=1130410 RepID=A0ABR1XLQ7_9PEZI